MEIQFLNEPLLEFGNGKHVCPRLGIFQHDVYDSSFEGRSNEIFLGAIGTAETIDMLQLYIDSLSEFIPAKEGNKQPGLYVPFVGFNKNYGFKTTISLPENNSKKLSKLEISEIKSDAYTFNQRVELAANHYAQKIEFLAENRNVDVIICIIPKDIYKSIGKKVFTAIDEQLDEEENENLEFNFRRLIKAKTMHLRIPLQLIREDSLMFYSQKTQNQDDATKAWNFSVATYYKARRNTVPWRLPQNDNQVPTCFIGIGFYKSRDRKVTRTSLAQVFDELGHGIILRGTEVEIRDEDNKPHLTEDDAHMLLFQALERYETALGHSPSRVVIHKSSNYYPEESEGFRSALISRRIQNWDFITILDSGIRLFRSRNYPPMRGTCLKIAKNHFLLYTRGSVQLYKTYPGQYIPQPIEVKIFESDESTSTILNEILSLTKMNWNNSQFDGKYPITLGCARRVGELMKYLGENDKPESRYAFYM